MKLKAEKVEAASTNGRIFRTLFFLFGGLMTCSIVTLLSFVGIMASVFFKAMIVWRGFSLSIDFEQIMQDAVKMLASIMSLPAIEYLFYPITYMFNLFSSL